MPNSRIDLCFVETVNTRETNTRIAHFCLLKIFKMYV